MENVVHTLAWQPCLTGIFLLRYQVGAPQLLIRPWGGAAVPSLSDYESAARNKLRRTGSTGAAENKKKEKKNMGSSKPNQ